MNDNNIVMQEILDLAVEKGKKYLPNICAKYPHETKAINYLIMASILIFGAYGEFRAIPRV